MVAAEVQRGGTQGTGVRLGMENTVPDGAPTGADLRLGVADAVSDGASASSNLRLGMANAVSKGTPTGTRLRLGMADAVSKSAPTGAALSAGVERGALADAGALCASGAVPLGTAYHVAPGDALVPPGLAVVPAHSMATGEPPSAKGLHCGAAGGRTGAGVRLEANPCRLDVDNEARA